MPSRRRFVGNTIEAEALPKIKDVDIANRLRNVPSGFSVNNSAHLLITTLLLPKNLFKVRCRCNPVPCRRWENPCSSTSLRPKGGVDEAGGVDRVNTNIRKRTKNVNRKFVAVRPRGSRRFPYWLNSLRCFFARWLSFLYQDVVGEELAEPGGESRYAAPQIEPRLLGD